MQDRQKSRLGSRNSLLASIHCVWNKKRHDRLSPKVCNLSYCLENRLIDFQISDIVRCVI